MVYPLRPKSALMTYSDFGLFVSVNEPLTFRLSKIDHYLFKCGTTLFHTVSETREVPFRGFLINDNWKNTHMSFDNNFLQTFYILISKSLWFKFLVRHHGVFSFFRNRTLISFWVSCIAFSAQQHII